MSEAKKEGFAITNDQMAQWAIEKIAQAKADTEKWKAHYAEALQKVQAANDETIAFMLDRLESYFDTLPHRKTATQESYALPGGKLVRKAQQPEFVRDEAQMIPWCKANGHGDAVNVKETINWALLKKLGTVQGEALIDTETGEAIPGVQVFARPDKFTVEGVEA